MSFSPHGIPCSALRELAVLESALAVEDDPRGGFASDLLVGEGDALTQRAWHTWPSFSLWRWSRSSRSKALLRVPVVSLLKPWTLVATRFEPPRGNHSAWPHAVIANGKLYIRHTDLLMCYDVKER